VRQKSCSRCETPFGCGPGSVETRGGCWCEDLPPLQVTPGADCLCPSCLREAVEAQAAA